MLTTRRVVLILTRDTAGYVVLARIIDGAASVVCRSGCPCNRDRNLRRAWLRAVATAEAAGIDVTAIDATCG